MKSGFNESLKVTEQTRFVKLSNRIILTKNRTEMKKFDLTVYSFNEVEPVSLEDVKGGFLGICCIVNHHCNKNTKDLEELKQLEKEEQVSDMKP